ncbi:hypothetical protein [Aeromonas rivuli]|uniref:hypothetical protein n=1 Tax=Aeromonas rivuli TaxID=648794 RepID=UPI001CCF5CD1|nr:hypothetical protein [Aeromonas rivuli]UBO74380.1 hypothetical protein KYK33_01880 [Aeromonas rivuli]
MSRYPTCVESRAHAKFISKTLDISLSYAQDVVALRYNCESWACLAHRFGTQADKYFAFYGLVNTADRDNFKNIISPYSQELKSHFNPERHVKESLIGKIVEGKISRISGYIISQFNQAINESETLSAERIISLLEYYDDSASHVLTSFIRQGNPSIINLHIEPWVFGQHFYSYYYFKNKTVKIVSREWDLEIETITSRKISAKPWFKQYMLGFLTNIARQFISLGFDGAIKICRINNFDVIDFQNGKITPYHCAGICELFSSLRNLGGKGQWSINDNGVRYDYGIEIPFTNLK